jgi:guanine deaminase
MKINTPFTILGCFAHTPEQGHLEIIERGLLSVDKKGWIIDIYRPSQHEYKYILDNALANGQLVKTDADCLIFPGMVDLHIHAPQWPQIGQALHLPLEDWLYQYTFPLEARYSDASFARKVFQDLVKTLIANGTTTGVYFSTIHQNATRILTEVCLELGQRAFVGKVVMDQKDQCPEYYRDPSTDAALKDTIDFIEFTRKLKSNESGLVQPVVTPRFIPSCSDSALEGLGQIALDYQCHIQTHCSESDWEHQFVIDRFGHTDTFMLNEYGLLNRKTILAHSNLISNRDMNLIKDAGAGIAHCPLSNIYFSNSVFPLRKALDKGLRVGLGTDISGGPSPSLLENCRYAISSSRMLEDGVNPDKQSRDRGNPFSRINFKEAFWLATAGGAEILDIPVGKFKKGYKFDALLIDPHVPGSNIPNCSKGDSIEDLFQTIIYNSVRGNIRNIWIDGIMKYSKDNIV